MKTGTVGLSPVASAMALDRMEAEEEQSSATDAKQKLLEGMPKFKFYRRRKTNRAPRKRTFIMHMTKTPDALIETVGAQRAAGGGGGGGKKRRHAALLGSDATSGGFHTGIGKEEPVIPAPAFSPFAAYSLNDLAPEVSNPSPAVPASSSAAPFTSPFASMTVGAVSVVGAASVSRLSPFASALAQALPAAVGLPPVLDPLSDSFMVPNKYGSSSDLAPAVVTAAGSSFAACITLSGAGSAAEAAAPQAKRSRRDAASESAPLRFALPGSEGSMIECDHSLGAGAFGTVWRGMLDSQPVAVKFPLGSDRPISPALSREGSGNSTFTFFGSAPSFGSFPSFPATAASNVSPLPSSALGLGLSDSEDGVTASEVAATFENELRALAAAGPHPHVVRAIAAQLGPSPCLVMELAPWGSLGDYLAQRQSRDWAALERTVLSRLAADLGHADVDSLLATVEARSAGQLPLPATRYLVALALLAQAAEGAAHLHRAGVVHRDIKPDNILIDSAGNARLADLGLARVASEGADALQLPTATPQFAAPEDLRGEDVTDRADTFSLANCVWQVLAGAIPWEGLAAASVMYRVGHAGATLAVPEAWPVAVRGLLASAWQQQAAARPASAEVSAALSAELRRFVA